MTSVSECKPLPDGWRDTADKLWAGVDRSSDDDACWPWTRWTVESGHGQITIAGRPRRVHRLVWALVHGEDPYPHYVLHRCDNPPCCNPRHLFLGTKKDNTQDMVGKGRGGRPKGSKNRHTSKGATHCIEGHAFTPENTYITPTTGARQCKKCRRIRARAAYHATKH
jgi:hypothetical protein